MELTKKNVRMNKRKCRSNLQITLEDDFNVPDTKPDVDRIVTEEGNIEITESNILNGKLMVKGVLHFQLLYISQESEQLVHNIQGKMEFDEMVNMEQLQAGDDIKVKWDLEDLNISLINSRKISVKSVVSLMCCAWEIHEEEVAVDIDEKEEIPCRYRKMNLTELVVDKKDIMRLKEEFRLPTGKPNIYQVLYHNIHLQGVEMRIQEGQILIRGEMVLFVLYTADEDRGQMQYYEAQQPFHNVIPCNGCQENMVLQVEKEFSPGELQIKQDEDGEERMMDAEMAINLDIHVYKDEEVEYLADLYSTKKDLKLELLPVEYPHLVLKNRIEKRLAEQITLEKQQNPILQICHSHGMVQIDEQEWQEDGIHIEGSVEVKVLYLGEADTWPIGEEKITVPFEHVIEGVGDATDKTFEIMPEIEQISTMLLGRGVIEVKATVNMEVLIFEKMTSQQLQQITEQEFDLEKLESMPSMSGYLVKAEEDLWSIAKKFHTTVEDIMELNDLEEQNVKTGDKLLLMKTMVTVHR